MSLMGQRAIAPVRVVLVIHYDYTINILNSILFLFVFVQFMFFKSVLVILVLQIKYLFQLVLKTTFLKDLI